MAAGAGHEGALGSIRIPPAWEPGTGYSFRDWELDVGHWRAATDLEENRIGGAIYQRLGGTAKTLAREIPSEIVAWGREGVAGVDILLNALRRRWAGEEQNRQLELVEAFETFHVMQHESVEDACTRFDIIRTRATAEAGVVTGFVQLARKLLKCFRVPREQWANLLVPTQGLLPQTEDDYYTFTLYL